MTSSLAFASTAADAPSDGAENARLESTLSDPIARLDWDALLNDHEDATTFHTTAWARVLARTYGHEPIYLSLSCGAQRIALLPLMEVRSRFTGHRAVSLPFSDFCGPLLACDGAGKLVSERIS